MKTKFASLKIFIVFFLVAGVANAQAPLVLQSLDYTEDPIDIPNPDRGPYRGRWQNIPPSLVTEANSPFGITPEVDHRVPVDANSVLSHGRQVPAVEGDDIEETQFYNGVNQNDKPYIGGTGVSALPSIAFMAFDLVNFSSNAFLSAKDAFNFKEDGLFKDPNTGASRTGKTQPLTDYALDYIRGLLQKVREGNGVAFEKFSYDGNGFSYIEPFKYPHLNLREGIIHGPEPTYISENNSSAMCDVPGHTNKDWIEYHLWQLKPIFHEFEDIIMCVKTGMLGPWGEQHSSPMSLNEESRRKVMAACLDAVPSSRILLTKQTLFLAWYNFTYGTAYTISDTLPTPSKGSPEARFGLYSDSFLSSNRPNSSSWIFNQNTMSQFEGGIGDNMIGNMPGAILEYQKYRATTVNMRHGNYQRWSNFIYNEANVTRPVQYPTNIEESRTQGPYTGPIKTAIFDPVYDGRNGLEYMRDRLGYRLVLREAKVSKWVKQNGTLSFEGKIQNVGFGNVVNRKNVSVILRHRASNTTFKVLTELDARDWMVDEGGNGRPDNTTAWRDLNFSIKLTAFGNVLAGDCDIYLKINDPKEQSENKRCIRFANKGNIWNDSLGANLIGSTSIIQNDINME